MRGEISTKAHAKINLYLHVTDRRDDGYHNLDSMVTFADFAFDNIHIQKADDFLLKIDGAFAPPVLLNPIEHNLVYKSHKAIEEYAGRTLPCHITLTKNIPIGAGLGGGSSDAAMTVKLLEDLYDIDIPYQKRDKILLELGADVPVCYHQKTICFSGIGDVLSPAPAIPHLYMILIWPNVFGNTQDVFKHYKGAFSKPIVRPASLSTMDDFIYFLNQTNNDLSQAAQELYPDIKHALSFMGDQNGCRIARMTGSGSCVFGIFEDEKLCAAAYKNADINGDWWTSYGMIKS